MHGSILWQWRIQRGATVHHFLPCAPQGGPVPPLRSWEKYWKSRIKLYFYSHTTAGDPWCHLFTENCEGYCLKIPANSWACILQQPVRNWRIYRPTLISLSTIWSRMCQPDGIQLGTDIRAEAAVMIYNTEQDIPTFKNYSFARMGNVIRAIKPSEELTRVCN